MSHSPITHARNLLFACVLLLLLPNQLTAEQESSLVPEIKVGVIVPLTGGWAIWGQGIQKAIQLYGEKNFSRVRWNFRFEDEGTCDPRLSLNAYKALRASDNVKIFILGCLTGAQVIAPVAKREGVLLLSAGFEQNEIFKVGAYLVNLSMQVDSEGRALGEAIKRASVKKLLIVRNDGVDDFIVGMKKAWGDEVHVARDLVVLSDDQNFVTLLSGLKRNEFDGVFFNLGEYQFLAALRRLRDLNLNVPVFMNYGADSMARSSKEVMKMAEGVMFTHPITPPSNSEFQDLFQKRFGLPPNITGIFSYDGLELLESLLPLCKGGLDIPCLFREFTHGGKRLGRGGPYTIHEDGSITRSFELRTIEHGQIITKFPNL